MPRMASFPMAAAPSAEKLRGGYYTPDLLSQFLGQWVLSAGPRHLEPSCGDGAILSTLSVGRKRAVGIELEPGEAAKARARCPRAEVVHADFFDWFDADQVGAWDGAAGNPPFIRFGNWTAPTRDKAF